MAIQKAGATIAVGEILRQAFDRRARDAGLVELFGIAADDMRDRLAAGGDAVRFERGRDVGDMAVQASLRDERAGDERRGQNAERQTQQCGLDEECKRANDGEQDKNRSNARRPPRLRGCGFTIERAVEPCDQAAHPGHRMADGAMQGCRIADAKLDQHGDEGKRDGHDHERRRGPKAVGRRPGTVSRRRSRRRPAPFSRRA